MLKKQKRNNFGSVAGSSTKMYWSTELEDHKIQAEMPDRSILGSMMRRFGNEYSILNTVN